MVQQNVGKGLGVTGEGGQCSSRDLGEGSIGWGEDSIGAWKKNNDYVIKCVDNDGA